ncbi:MAG: hypothetical protein K6T66_04910 [Peptococcaceae bacterium]|nr:hypothetical protein [Peptococcaceae bacterium]
MCPACSGLITTGPDCPCGEEMEDGGPAADYFGPYSPYFNAAFESTGCVHLFTCPACGSHSLLYIPLREV